MKACAFCKCEVRDVAKQTYSVDCVTVALEFGEYMKSEVDRYFPRNGPCMFHWTRYARHRVIDAIRARYAAGESIAHLAKDYQRSRAAICAAVNSTSDDNRMTPKEIREGKEMWKRFTENPYSPEFD